MNFSAIPVIRPLIIPAIIPFAIPPTFSPVASIGGGVTPGWLR
jgi:hypothetical protein